jgi:hypothetical protein
VYHVQETVSVDAEIADMRLAGNDGDGLVLCRHARKEIQQIRLLIQVLKHVRQRIREADLCLHQIFINHLKFSQRVEHKFFPCVAILLRNFNGIQNLIQPWHLV